MEKYWYYYNRGLYILRISPHQTKIIVQQWKNIFSYSIIQPAQASFEEKIRISIKIYIGTFLHLIQDLLSTHIILESTYHISKVVTWKLRNEIDDQE